MRIVVLATAKAPIATTAAFHMLISLTGARYLQGRARRQTFKP
jgi:sensor histidine kinase regulating citrate/malate metabolism